MSPKTHSQSENLELPKRAADYLGFLKKLFWLFEGPRKLLGMSTPVLNVMEIPLVFNSHSLSLLQKLNKYGLSGLSKHPEKPFSKKKSCGSKKHCDMCHILNDVVF